MLVQIILLIVASLMVSYSETAKVVRVLLQGLMGIHDTIFGWLGVIFSSGSLAVVIKESLALFILPMAITGLVALAYWSIRRHRMPHFMVLFWVIWLIQTAIVVIMAKYA